MNRKQQQRQNRKAASSRESSQVISQTRRRRQRTGRKTLHYLLLLIILLSAGTILSLTVFFKIEAVYVVGTDKYDPLELAAASGVVEGSNLLRIDKDAIAANLIGPYVYIDSVEISRRLPATVEIAITQSVPAMAVKEGDSYVLMTREGKVLERDTLMIPDHIPLIKGLDTRLWTPGMIVGTPAPEPPPSVGLETAEQTAARAERNLLREDDALRAKESLVMLKYLFDAIETSGFGEITNVDVTDRLNMKIMYENRLLLELGSEIDLTYKLEFLQLIIKNRIVPDARGVLHAGDASNKKVVFSPAADYDSSLAVLPSSPADDELPEVEEGPSVAWEGVPAE